MKIGLIGCDMIDGGNVWLDDRSEKSTVRFIVIMDRHQLNRSITPKKFTLDAVGARESLGVSP